MRTIMTAERDRGINSPEFQLHTLNIEMEKSC
jgi:hypothetical protein